VLLVKGAPATLHDSPIINTIYTSTIDRDQWHLPYGYVTYVLFFSSEGGRHGPLVSFPA
jgi:hypothetical protein